MLKESDPSTAGAIESEPRMLRCIYRTVVTLSLIAATTCLVQNAGTSGAAAQAAQGSQQGQPPPPQPGQTNPTNQAGQPRRQRRNAEPPSAPPTPGSFDPRETFAPLVLPTPVNRYRSSNGAPGPDYWQNEADYELHATINTAAHTMTTVETITYTNNSPDTLPILWVQMDQNMYKRDSRASNIGGGASRERREYTDGFVIDVVEVEPLGHVRNTTLYPTAANAAALYSNVLSRRASNGESVSSGAPDRRGRSLEGAAQTQTSGTVGNRNGTRRNTRDTRDTLQTADTVVSDTRMLVRLPQPLAPHSAMRLHIRYHYTIPGLGGGRTSWGKSPKGEIYDIAQWYPRMCVYDDLRGWDTLPYIGSEFYLEYGHFDYYVTVPANFLIAGSGELMNPNEVLTKTQIARLEQARHSDATVLIRSVAEVDDATSRPHPANGTLTWHFAMDHTRDVAFSASPAFVWDAARINLPNQSLPGEHPMGALPAGKIPLAMSVYPPESTGQEGWSRSTEYMKDAVENFSRRWFPYPWPAAINVAGFSTGMEYPGIVFDGITDKGKELFWVSAHEIGHGWFPMIVGSNERRHAFMDEGFNTFIDVYESDDFNHGEYGPKRDSEYSEVGEPADSILTVLNDPAAPTIMMPADAVSERYRHSVEYFKPAFGNVMLREQILGHERFDLAFRRYIRDWAYKHPSPSDYFRTMASDGGEDLDYFWRGWYFNNWHYDLALVSAKYSGGDPMHGVDLTLANDGHLPLPTTIEIVFKDGSKQRQTLPVEMWLTKTQAVLHLATTKPVATITADPDHKLPDEDRSNNKVEP
jgi:hypothetical protein